jgi:hypothetical protein
MRSFGSVMAGHRQCTWHFLGAMRERGDLWFIDETCTEEHRACIEVCRKMMSRVSARFSRFTLAQEAPVGDVAFIAQTRIVDGGSHAVNANGVIVTLMVYQTGI